MLRSSHPSVAEIVPDPARAIVPIGCRRRLLVIDAVDVGKSPGMLLRFEGQALRGLPGKATVHQLGFADLLVALELIGESSGEPVVLGIQPKSTKWGSNLTEPVDQALGSLVSCAIVQLELTPSAEHRRAPIGIRASGDKPAQTI